MGWYQPIDRHERYRTLVNSHLTWLVEFGWGGRFALIWAWLLALGFGCVRWRARGDPLPLAVWISFATAAFFSSVAEDWVVGVVPAVTLAPATWTFCSATATTRRVVAISTLLASGFVLSVFVVLGVSCRPTDVLPIHRALDGTRLTVGKGSPKDWVVYDAETMGGAAFGRLLRAFAQTSDGQGRSYGIACDLEAVPTDARRLALCGRSADAGPRALARFAALTDVRILSPNRPADWLLAHGQRPSIRVFCGEFAPACPAEDVKGLTVISGAAGYLPGWPRLAFGR